jgi:hypothetical protein
MKHRTELERELIDLVLDMRAQLYDIAEGNYFNPWLKRADAVLSDISEGDEIKKLLEIIEKCDGIHLVFKSTPKLLSDRVESMVIPLRSDQVMAIINALKRNANIS